ncbi:MAG: 3-hydroxyacyl-ACP dehydratase FabZ [Enterobacteriaceae bacterium]
MLNIKSIVNYLPYRHPFLFIDRILKIKYGKYVHTIKNISYNDFFFKGHFHNNPVFPGVLIIESIAQAAGLLVYENNKKLKIKELYYLAKIEHAIFKSIVHPGDQLFIKVKLKKKIRNIVKFIGFASVNEKIVCTTKIICAKKK